MARARGSWYEREEEERVNLDWVKTNCRMTKRESELIQLVYDRKLVRRDHLEVISKSYRELGDNRTRLMNRAIKKLYQSLIFDKTHEPQVYGQGNTPAIVAIDRGGSVLLNVPHKKRILQYKYLVNDKAFFRKKLPITFRHINGINQCEVDTILFCEETGCELLGWHHEKPQELHIGGEKKILVPDVRVHIKMQEKPFYGFLEYDTGKEDRRNTDKFPTLDDKIKKYRRWNRSEIWKEEYPYFPVIMFVTEDDKRVEYFTKKCKENGLRGFGIYYDRYSDWLKHLSKVF